MFIAFDLETSGLDYWSPHFKVTSAAFTWRKDGELKSRFVEGAEETRKALEGILGKGHTLVVHNASFEYAVTKHALGLDLPLDRLIDTQRLVQFWGLEKTFASEKATAWGLEASVERIFAVPHYKKKYHDWLKENVPEARRKPGRFIAQLPPDLLEEYNCLDTEWTLKIFERLSEKFAEMDFDWRYDHSEFYLPMVAFVADAKARGILVQRESLSEYVQAIGREVERLDAAFCQRYTDELLVVRNSLRAKKQAKYKKKIVTELPPFNVNSKHQLKMLFCDVLQMVPRITTKKGAPSFNAKHLHQWGSGGQMLESRGKRLKVREHASKLFDVSADDGRWHAGLRLCGTVTGRFAGSDGLNAQGLARRDSGLMSALVAEPGRVFCSLDLSAGEPTIIAHYTGDRNYRAVTLDMVGKAPYWDKNVFLIDDIYLSYMAATPMGRPIIEDAWRRIWDGYSFADCWMRDSEVIKKALKKQRQIYKALALGLGYGMQPRKLHQTAHENGFMISEAEAVACYRSYWSLFADVRKFAEHMERKAERQGYLVNEFGYFQRNVEPRKAFNFLIQSSVNPAIIYFTRKLLQHAPYARFVLNVHDEVIIDLPADCRGDLEQARLAAEDDLNAWLEWSVRLRTGMAFGGDLYSAK